MKYIAITGASGVVGTRLRELYKDTSFLIFDGDIRDEKAVQAFCLDSAQCDALVHLAAVVPKQAVDSDTINAFDVNVRGTLNVLEGLKRLGAFAPWLFYASSSHVYASSTEKLKEDSGIGPFTFYGLTKLQAEHWCEAYRRDFGVKVCIGRIFSFTDPLQSKLYFIPAMIHKIKNADKGATLEISGINGWRDFLTVPQICNAIYKLQSVNYEGVVNIGTGNCAHLLAVVKRIAEFLGRTDLNIVAKEDVYTGHVADVTLLNSLGIRLESILDSVLSDMTR